MSTCAVPACKDIDGFGEFGECNFCKGRITLTQLSLRLYFYLATFCSARYSVKKSVDQ